MNTSLQLNMHAVPGGGGGGGNWVTEEQILPKKSRHP